MPKKSKPRQTARSARKSIVRRDRGPIDGRQTNRGTKENRPDFLADSISAVRLGTIPGAKAISAISVVGGFQLLIGDVSKCVRKMYPKQKLKAPTGLADYEVFGWWQTKLLEALPVGASYNFNGDETGFWIDIFQEEDWTDWKLYHLYCDDILSHLKRTDRKGHELFVRFLNQIAHVIKCDTWASGLFAESIDWLEEMIECDPDAIGTDNLQLCKDEVFFFQKGEGHELGRRIHRDRSPGIEYLLIESARVKDPFIRELIRLGCELMEAGYGMTDFVDVIGHQDDDYSEMGLRFDSQACLMHFYRNQSPASYEYDSRIEMYSQEGGFASPYNQVRIRPNDKKLPDFNEFEKRRQWLKELLQFFNSWISVSQFYYDERVEQQIKVTV